MCKENILTSYKLVLATKKGISLRVSLVHGSKFAVFCGFVHITLLYSVLKIQYVLVLERALPIDHHFNAYRWKSTKLSPQIGVI